MRPPVLLVLGAALAAGCAPTPHEDAPTPHVQVAATDPADDCETVVNAWVTDVIHTATTQATPGSRMPEIADLPEDYRPVGDAIIGDVALAAGNPGTVTGHEAYDRAQDTITDQCQTIGE